MLQWMPIKFNSIVRTATIASLFLLAVFWFLPPQSAQAQAPSGVGGDIIANVEVMEQPLGLPVTDIRIIVARIIRVALGLVGIVLLGLVLYSGFLWMTAGGNEDQISTAKKMLVNAAIGLAIILSAYAIVSFIIGKLIDATGGGAGGGGFGAPTTENFVGSGALGKIIQDHYPTRDQTNVPRNTKIVVTFRSPIKVDSFVEDTTGDGIFGNCLATIANWNTDCDHARFGDDFIRIKRTDNNESINGAVVLASRIFGPGGIYFVKSIVIKPITDNNNPDGGYLGSSIEPVSYTVRLGQGILLDDQANNNPSAFQTRILGNNYYEWKFTNGTALDTAAPYVSNVFPAQGVSEASNSVIQINFSEPMDPIGIQGGFNTNPDYYYLEGGSVYLKAGNSTVPLGNFSLVNNYHTLEFTPSRECGRNACGGKIYCLPVCDRPGAACTQDYYEVLLRAARVLNPSSFAAHPFSGISDLSGNALDGNKNNIPNSATSSLPIFPTQKQPDNYFWNFNITNQIDATAPYIHTVVPGLDAQNIARDQELSILFSKRMRAESIYSISIVEHPTHAIPIWYVPFSTFSPSNTTYSRLGHGPFLDSLRQYYFPVVSSTVEDVHFNCFFPGKGPDQQASVGGVTSPECNNANPQNCCEVINAQTQAFCCNGAVDASIPACLQYLRTNSL